MRLREGVIFSRLIDDDGLARPVASFDSEIELIPNSERIPFMPRLGLCRCL